MLCDQLVTEAIRVNSIDSERLLVFCVEHLGSVEQINIRNFAYGCGCFGGSSILHEASVVRLAIGQIGIVQILVGNRRTKHNARRSLATVVLLFSVVDPLH